MTAAPRIGIIGPRRARQGLGPFVARDLVAEGCTVPAILATRPDSLAEAQTQLFESAGIEPRGYLDLGTMLAEESLDALAILSPPGAHLPYLSGALEAGLHAFCEKPFLWDGDDLAGTARRLTEGFAERGLLLLENCQWPETLPAFRRLHPDLGDGPPSRFRMRLTPASSGLQLLGDALPHPFSLLQALAPSRTAELARVRFSTTDPEASELVFECDYLADGHPIETRVELARGDSQPREAAYEVDGHEAKRLIRTSDYALFFASGSRVVDVPDPLRCRIARFSKLLTSALKRGANLVSEDPEPSGPTGLAQELGGDPRTRELARIVQRMELLETSTAAFEGGQA